MGGELIGDFGPGARFDQNVTARDVKLIGKRKRHRVAGLRFLGCAVIGHDVRDVRRAPGGGDHNGIALVDASRCNGPRIAAKIEIGPVHPLHLETERLGEIVARHIGGLEMLEQSRPTEPRRVAGKLDHVVAVARRDRDRHHRGEAELGREGEVIADDAAEYILLIVDEVNLVHRHHDVAHAEQRADKRVPPRLREHALARIDQDHGKLRVRGAGRHVARILLMPRRVGDDERAPRRGEEPVGDVDGDALLALRLEPVEQQGEVDLLAGRAVPPRVLGQGRELILEDQLGIVQQPSDQGRLAVVNRAAGDEAQQVLGAAAFGFML